jgi:hypothetical protein
MMIMNTNAQFKAVMEINLDSIKAKLMHLASGEGWSLDKADAVEKEYRRFLCLMKKYPNENTAPLVDVDTFWHYHILDTMKYAVDCEQAFGYFLHHYPYVGMNGEEDEQVRLDAGDRMRELNEATFGDAYPAPHAGGVHTVAAAYRRVAANDSIAYCRAAANDASAYCRSAVTAQTAYCRSAVQAQTAYCRSAVTAQTAYCRSAVNDDSAYCRSAIAPAAGKQTAEAALAA